MGNLVILPVCTSVTASNSSSSVPNPPGSTTKACEYLTNMVLRTKKYLNSRPMSTNSFSPCSCGNSMPRPTEIPCALAAPLLAASMMPGPPPVLTAYPAVAGPLGQPPQYEHAGHAEVSAGEAPDPRAADTDRPGRRLALGQFLAGRDVDDVGRRGQDGARAELGAGPDPGPLHHHRAGADE